MSRTYKTYKPEEDLRIAQLIAEGKTTKEIAALLTVDVQVIDYRLQKLRKKQQCLSTPHLIAKMVTTGMIAPNL